jgi:hypothetical protein
MKARACLMALVVVLALVPTAHAADGVDALIGKVMEHYNNHDANGLQSLWEQNGRLISRHGEIVGAKLIGDQYRAVFSELIPGETLSLRARVEESWVEDDSVTAWGVFSQIHMGEVVDHGRFVVRAVKKGSGFKLSRVWVLGDPRE